MSSTKIVFFYLVSALIFFNLYIFPDSFVSAADPYYEACIVPRSCGNQIISFPFYIQGLQEPYCGYPGFNLSCDPNGRSILKISGQNYVVRQIFYQNQSIIVSNAAFSDLDENACIPYVPHLTLSPEFEIVRNQQRVVLLYNCEVSSSIGRGNTLLKNTIGCYAGNPTQSVLAIYESDGDQLAEASRVCGVTGDVAVANTTAAEGGSGNEGMVTREKVRRGFMLTWLASNCSVCELSHGRCGFFADIYHFKCFCPDLPHALKCFPPPPGLGQGLRLGLGLGITLGGLGIVVSVVLLARRLWNKHQTNENVEAFLKSCGPFQVRRYSYSNIKKMTNSFSQKLGQGGFGHVYKGKLDDGRLIAVKVLNQSKGEDGQEFINEVASISRTSHVNVVMLLGFCFDGPKRALIYEFMPNGSLEKFIFDDNAVDENSHYLDWETYHQISLGIAKGLEYLHRGCNTQILHFDIKPHNILLDVGFVPKISDFGLAKICKREESRVSMLGPRGTIGYIAPEVFNRNFGSVSHKSDVYSYGMMVLEMIGGRKNINIQVNNTSEIYFPHWIYKRLELGENLGLKRIINEGEGMKVKKMIIVSLWCIQTNPSDRPAISRVIEMLEGGVDSLEVPPMPFLYSPRRSPPQEESSQAFL